MEYWIRHFHSATIPISYWTGVDLERWAPNRVCWDNSSRLS